MTAALIVLAFLFAIQTVRLWIRGMKLQGKELAILRLEAEKASVCVRWHEAERDAHAARMVGRAAMKCLSDDAILDEEYLEIEK